MCACVWSLSDSPSAARQDLEPAGMYRLCKKLDDDDLCVGAVRSKPVKKSRKDRRKISVVSLYNICVSHTADSGCEWALTLILIVTLSTDSTREYLSLINDKILV